MNTLHSDLAAYARAKARAEAAQPMRAAGRAFYRLASLARVVRYGGRVRPGALPEYSTVRGPHLFRGPGRWARRDSE